MIYIGGDKHGYATIQMVREYLSSQGVKFEDLGVQTAKEDIPLEELIPRLAGKVLENPDNLGILSCGTGIGIEMGANKIKGIRATRATDEKTAAWSREYDNCNVLCLPGWEIEKDQIGKVVKVWLQVRFDGDAGRAKMLETFDTWR